MVKYPHTSMYTKIYTFVITSLIIVGAVSSVPAYAFDFSKVDSTATVFSAIGNGIGDFFGFFTETVIGKVRNDFCGNYFSSMASGEWKADEFRARLGASSCSENTAIKIDNSLKKNSVTVATTTVNAAPQKPATKIEVLKPTVQKTAWPVTKAETSGPLLGSTAPDGTKLSTSQILYWTNQERIKAGEGSLVENSSLDAVANARVNDMFEKGYFEHTSPTGDTASLEADKYGYKYIVIGENIALGNFDDTQALLAAWMASEGHRKNILNVNYTEIGIASKEANYKGTTVWISAQIFAKSLAPCSQPDVSLKAKIDKDYVDADTYKAQAQVLLKEINTINSALNPNLYNSKVTEYKTTANSINKIISEMKSYTDTYNSEVRAFNECIKLN